MFKRPNFAAASATHASLHASAAPIVAAPPASLRQVVPADRSSGARDDGAVSLSDFAFTDLYLAVEYVEGQNPPGALYVPELVDVNQSQTARVPESCREEIEELRNLLREQEKLRPEIESFGRNSKPRWYNGMVTFRGMRMRYALTLTTRGELWASLRHITYEIPPLESLGVSSDWLQLISTLGRQRSGLVLVSGTTGAGKTTTLVSMLAHFMRLHGKRAFTIEDPCEYLLQGPHGDGYCFQNEADENGGWVECIKTALRSHPDYIMLGEIRDSDVARETIRAAMSGHLVFSTIHGGSVVDALDAIVRLSGGSDSASIREQIGQQLLMIIHQERFSGRIEMNVLDNRAPENRQQFRKSLAENRTAALGSSSFGWIRKFAPEV